MQGQRNLGNSFSEIVDLNQGAGSSNNCPSQPMDNHDVQGFDRRHIGESSSSSSPNLQLHGVDSDEKNETSFETPPVGSSSNLFWERVNRPLNINLNTENMETEDTFPFNFGNNEGASSSSFGDWGSSVRRKVHDGACSNDFQACNSGSSSLRTHSPPLHPPSFSNSEELSLGIGIGRGVASDVFPPTTITETGESSSRRHGVSVNNDYNIFNLPISRNTERESPRPNNPSNNFGFGLASNRARSQDEPMHTPDSPRNMPHLYDTRNSLNLSPENVGNSGSERGSFRNFDRSSQFYPRGPFSSAEAEIGNRRREHSPPLRTESSSSEEMMMSSEGNQGHRRHSHRPFRRSSRMELTGDEVSGWHGVTVDIEGRQRMVSEIRHVLNAMRRRDNLRDEDYMLFDPFINGAPEFHDRHRDMRLDVDNMSYEELLALGERIGDVNTGLSEEAILSSMKQRKHLCLFESSSSTLEPCSICREDYILGDNVGELDCGHDFHTDCIKQWLTQKNLCPICKITALAT